MMLNLLVFLFEDFKKYLHIILFYIKRDYEQYNIMVICMFPIQAGTVVYFLDCQRSPTYQRELVELLFSFSHCLCFLSSAYLAGIWVPLRQFESESQ